MASLPWKSFHNFSFGKTIQDQEPYIQQYFTIFLIKIHLSLVGISCLALCFLDWNLNHENRSFEQLGMNYTSKMLQCRLDYSDDERTELQRQLKNEAERRGIVKDIADQTKRHYIILQDKYNALQIRYQEIEEKMTKLLDDYKKKDVCFCLF